MKIDKPTNEELKIAKEKAEESEANVTAILEGTNSSIWAFDRQYKIIYINPVFQKEFIQSFGVTLEPGMSLIEALPKPLQPIWKPRYDRVLANEHFTIEDAVPTGNGTIYVEVTFNPIIKNGKVIGGSCFGNDITARKNAELEIIKAKEQTEESERKFQLIVNQNPSPLAVVDTKIDKILYWSDSATQKLGHTPKTVSEWFDVAYPNAEYKKRVIEHWYPKVEEAAKTQKATYTGEYDVTCKNGSVITGEFFVQFIPNHLIITLNDVTDRKNAEKELLKAKEKAEESEKQLRLISDNFANGMIYQVAMLDENRRQFNYISKNVEELYGVTAKEAQKDANLIYNKIHPDDIEGLINKEKEALKKMSPFETEARTITPSGKIRWAYYISKPRIINGVVCWDGVEIDITERKQMELELIKAKERAEEADRLKSAFLANMSHEIRTPMNGIMGFTNLLQQQDLTGEERNEYIEIIKKSGNRMLNTVNDIIEISKIETGQIKVISTEVNISEYIFTLHKFFKLEAEKKGLELLINNDLSEQESLIITDKNKLSSILTNLIKNSLKFTKEGHINIGLRINGNVIEMVVKDTGIGIPADRQVAIFNRFEQADIEDKHAHEGSGLGLAIAKSYVEMLGGTIWVESELNKGSTFFFTISYNPVNAKTVT